MKKTAALLAFLLPCCIAAIAQHPSSSWPERLAGRWEGDLGGRRYVEEWHLVNDSTCIGRALMYAGERVVSREEMRLIRFAGHWLYLADPGGQGVTCFVRGGEEGDTWTFENREHDFPKRIGYRIEGDALTAWIAGASDDDHHMVFPLKRVSRSGRAFQVR